MTTRKIEERIQACRYCKRLRGKGCDAFPRGIPAEIMRGDDFHLSPIEGDRGLTFELEPESFDEVVELIAKEIVPPSMLISSAARAGRST